MRKELIPSLVICAATAFAVGLGALSDLHRPLVATLKIVASIALLGLGLSLAFSKKRQDVAKAPPT